jgi:hypothetical protein
MNKNANKKIAAMIRSRLHDALKNNYKTGFTVDTVGCTIESLKQYLEARFQPGMTWDNQGKWHLDHVIPLSSFNLSDKRELKKACHYTNLQPMWARDNLKKNDKYTIVLQSVIVENVGK